MFRVPFTELLAAFESALLANGMQPARALHCATIFAESTRDGITSHGINRFPRFIQGIHNGSIQPNAEPTLVQAFGGIERWDGNLGPGPLNAYACTVRAIELARQHGIGCVALRNTNHWMRGGSYGWQAADANMFALCWTNTLPNLPAWGASAPVVGNNPLVIAIPRPAPATRIQGASGDAPHVVLDMAMSQFSYGALSNYAKRGEPLPLDGGFDKDGNITRDAAAIYESMRPLPIGYWKGSGLSLVLDMLAAMLSGGRATHQMPNDIARESNISQVFLVIDPTNLAPAADLNQIADAILEDLHHAPRADAAKAIRYPGEQTLTLREQNLRLGVPVDEDMWKEVIALAK
jgi:3-dehydro-L-gulonate 2-dehydrogenase